MTDHSQMRLGLKPPKLELLARLPGMDRLGVTLPTALPECDWARSIQPTHAWGMDLNDSIGDCTIATVDHARKLWSVNAGRTFTEPTAAELIAAYSAVSGYVPGEPRTDNGAIWTDVLMRWRTNGFTLGGVSDQCATFVRVNPRDENEMKLAIQWFGCVMIGVALPISAQYQSLWDVVEGPDGEPGSWGGHAVPIVAYTPDKLTAVSWGRLKPMTRRFGQTYIDEAYAVLSPDWIATSGKTPAGIALADINADLDNLAAAA